MTASMTCVANWSFSFDQLPQGMVLRSQEGVSVNSRFRRTQVVNPTLR
jgi:hypothetical protein